MQRHGLDDTISGDRRRFLGNAAFAAASLSVAAGAVAQVNGAKPAAAPAAKPSMQNSFGPLKQVPAGVQDIGYAEVGHPDGTPVLLLHGLPYDIHSFVDVAPLLSTNSYRVIVPFLRGYGTTRFLSGDTARNGQPSAFAVDAIALVDALSIDKAVLAGFD